MSLKPREKIVLWIGAAIVIVGAVVRMAPGMSAPADGDSLNGLLTRMETFVKLKTTVEQQQAALKIEIPKVGPAEQEARVRESLGKLGQSGGMKVGPLKKIERASRVAGSNLSADFQFDAMGQYDQFVKFLATLETEKTPFKIMEVRIESGPGNIGNQGGGGGGGGGNRGGGERQADGQVHGSVKVRAYFFPRVFLEPKTEEKKAESSPKPAQEGDAPAMTPQQQQATSATVEVKTGDKPTVSPTPTPEATAAKKSGRYRIRIQMGDQTIEGTIDGRTATFMGQTKELTDEELANWRNELPPGAEVIEE